MVLRSGSCGWVLGPSEAGERGKYGEEEGCCEMHLFWSCWCRNLRVANYIEDKMTAGENRMILLRVITDDYGRESWTIDKAMEQPR